MSVHSSAHQMPGRPRGPRCCSPAGRGFYPDPSRAPRRVVFDRPVGDRGGRDGPRDFAGGDGWPVAFDAGAARVGRAHRSTRAPGNTGDTPRTAFRNHRRGNAVERRGLARCAAPGPAGRTGHGHPARDKVTISLGEPAFLGPRRNPDRCQRSGFRFSACGIDSLLQRRGAPSARMTLALSRGGHLENNVYW
jgi:hypothetical protein